MAQGAPREARPPQGRIYDLTPPIRAGMAVWPGDPSVSVEALPAPEGPEVGAVHVSRLTLGSHTGAHVDAPAHLLPGGGGVDALPIGILLGPARVLHLGGREPISAQALRQALGDAPPERLLLRTANSDEDLVVCDEGLAWAQAFTPDYVALEAEAARWLAAQGARLVGLDALSVDPYDAEDLPAHRALLEAGVVIVEGLDLRGVPAGDYWLCCLPLNLAGGDGAPARVVLVEGLAAT
jgi:arylformamidase